MSPQINIGDESFDRQAWPFFWITQATGRYLRVLERHLKRDGLDVTRWRVLMCVQPGYLISVGEIAGLAIVKIPTMTKIIQRMQGEGLVQTRARPDDGRVTEVALTPIGQEARHRAWASALKIYNTVFADMATSDQEKLNALLKTICSRLDD